MRTLSPPSHHNNFGFLRLLFASLVVVSHSPELVDGDSSREILTRLFGTLSFGEFSVDGFFLVSGFLITKSFVERPDPVDYFLKRIFRIVPGYLVAFWICVVLLAPFVGGSLSLSVIGDNILRTLLLLPPEVPGAFARLPYPALNGSMWTISYEFRCYLVVGLLGMLGGRVGWTQRAARRVLLTAMVLAMIVNGSGALRGMHGFHPGLFGSPEQNIRFLMVFGVGSLFFLFRDRIRLTDRGAAAAALLLLALLGVRPTAEAAVALLGGYLTFWFALACRYRELPLLGSRNDISYGLYLYAWPIQSLLIALDRSISPWLVCLLTLPLAALAGALSWHLVEQRANLFARTIRRSVAPPAAPGFTTPGQAAMGEADRSAGLIRRCHH